MGLREFKHEHPLLYANASTIIVVKMVLTSMCSVRRFRFRPHQLSGKEYSEKFGILNRAGSLFIRRKVAMADKHESSHQ
ncbi:hypothetical protein BDV24DRAFT_107681 [Aspergillus arachidicola]|uniref:Uncharacterized protein n=1 Tax=Aspergillus arachidicola TaxID=656916 RepID=A0A5N6YJ57_9EURO|nr:hypothetical protein BDV24DRAFT_107681 [Aspergillus arachidicola]